MSSLTAAPISPFPPPPPGYATGGLFMTYWNNLTKFNPCGGREGEAVIRFSNRSNDFSSPICDVIATTKFGSEMTGTLNYLAKYTPDGSHIGNSAVYESGGRVGIGTPDPKTLLDMNFYNEGEGGGKNYALQVTNNATVAGSNAGIRIRTSAPQSRSSIAFENSTKPFGGALGYKHDQDRFEFWTSTGGTEWSPKVFINKLGNVGIGTEIPQRALHVVQNKDTNDGTNAFIVSENIGLGSANIMLKSSNINGIQFNNDPGYNFDSSRNRAALAYDPIARVINFWTLSGTEWSPKVFINKLGNVGIGTPDPKTLLDMNFYNEGEGGGKNYALQVTNNATVAGSNAGIRIRTSAPQSRSSIAFENSTKPFGGALGYKHDQDRFEFWTSTGGTEWSPKVYIANNGNMGIGKNSFGSSYALNVEGQIQATAFLYSSDIRLKDYLSPLTSSLEKVTKLNGYSFSWKEDGKRDIGVIAQEVEKVFPEIVHSSGSGGYKSVEYGNLIAPVIEAIKELHSLILRDQGDIRALKEENRTQQREIEYLKKEIKEMGKYIKQ